MAYKQYGSQDVTAAATPAAITLDAEVTDEAEEVSIAVHNKGALNVYLTPSTAQTTALVVTPNNVEIFGPYRVGNVPKLYATGDTLCRVTVLGGFA